MNYANLESVNPEVRAYIYQQISDLEQYLPEGSAISIVIGDGKSKKKLFETQIKIETPFGEIQALETAKDVYESLSHAKENLIKQLGEIHRAVTSDQDLEMDENIRAMMNKDMLH